MECAAQATHGILPNEKLYLRYHYCIYHLCNQECANIWRWTCLHFRFQAAFESAGVVSYYFKDSEPTNNLCSDQRGRWYHHDPSQYHGGLGVSRVRIYWRWVSNCVSLNHFRPDGQLYRLRTHYNIKLKLKFRHEFKCKLILSQSFWVKVFRKMLLVIINQV